MGGGDKLRVASFRFSITLLNAPVFLHRDRTATVVLAKVEIAGTVNEAHYILPLTPPP